MLDLIGVAIFVLSKVIVTNLVEMKTLWLKITYLYYQIYIFILLSNKEIEAKIFNG